MQDSNLAVALACADAGLFVFPCNPITQNPSVKGNWRVNSTNDARIIKEWWSERAGHLVAIDLGKSGLLALDGDRHPNRHGEIVDDGVDALRNLFRQHGYSLKPHPAVWTPSDGVHVYFRSPEDFGNGEGDLPPGINVRGSGGYTVAPGCTRPAGRKAGGCYEPADGHPGLLESYGSIPELPPWLAQIINPPRPEVPPPEMLQKTGRRQQRFAIGALNGLVKELAAMAPESGRNIELNNAALRMGSMAARGWIERSPVERALYSACVSNSLVRDTGARSVKATIASGFNAGLRKPHADLRDRQ
jgi:Bifunctional DNA primase/polymerase, N-terminal